MLHQVGSSLTNVEDVLDRNYVHDVQKSLGSPKWQSPSSGKQIFGIKSQHCPRSVLVEKEWQMAPHSLEIGINCAASMAKMVDGDFQADTRDLSKTRNGLQVWPDKDRRMKRNEQ